MRKSILLVFASLIVPIFAAADSHSSAVTMTCAANAQLLQRSELYFGLSRADGDRVSDQEFQAFIDQEVTPRFPDGFTIVHGYGQWRQQDGVIAREASRMLVLLHKKNAENHIEIEGLRASYRQRFKQESVLRVDSTSCVSF